jgi:tripartite-type tricarboxylate transporter receptor subunit TctC
VKLARLLAALVAAYASAGCAATPAEYPTKPVRMIVSTSPSGGTDYAARLFGQKLSEMWGRSIVIDNRPGATGMIGLDVVAHANPDGYTLLVMNVGHLITATLSERLTFDPMKDLLPVSVVATTPVICVVNSAVNAKTVQELIALAKAQPGKLLYASGGTGGVQHVATELLKQEAKIELVHVPYKGTGPGLIDLISGQVQLTMTSVPSVVPHVSSGKLRALAVTGDARLEALASVPTFREVGLPGVNVVIWYGLLAPARTPQSIVNRIANSVAEAAKSPDMKEKMTRSGADPVGNTPAEFGAYYKSERDRWGRIARQAKIRLE